jgi:thiol-disulfide isomerase/thioredoxin
MKSFSLIVKLSWKGSLAFLLVFLTACSDNNTSTTDANSAEKSIVINGTISDGAGVSIVLFEFKTDTPVAVDTIVLDDKGKFSFTIPAEGYNFYGIGENYNQAALLLLKAGDKVQLSGNLAEWNVNFDCEGSDETTLLTAYYKKRYEFGAAMQNLQIEATMLEPGDGMNKAKIEASSQAMIAEFDAYKYEFIEENISSPVVFIAFADIYDLEKDREVLKNIEATMKSYMPNSKFTEAVSAKVKQSEAMEQELAAYAEQKKMMEAQMLTAGIGVGMPAKEVNLPNPEGKMIALSSLKGKVVLLDFWASWCKPCRMENPHVVELYNKYNKKGFTVYSVSLDNQKENWVSAIQADGLVWPNHVSDLKGWQSAAGAIYMVNSIPQTFLIDADGKIIAIGLRSNELEKYLQDIFG